MSKRVFHCCVLHLCMCYGVLLYFGRAAFGICSDRMNKVLNANVDKSHSI